MAKKKKAAAARIVENNEEEDDEEDEEEDDEQNSYDSLEEDSAEDDDDLEEFGEDEDDDFSSKESIINLLDPFGKEQLLAIVKDAALKHPSLLYRVLDAANADPVHRNIFVHGLGWDATSKTLTDAFSPFGEIEECKVVGDRVTGRCKGYGFVLFRSRVAAQRALKEPQKQIGNRTASCQLAAAGPPPAAGQGSYLDSTGRRIFVNNVGEKINPEKLHAFFSKFGEIEQGPLGLDPVTGKLRGYAIFVYKTVEGCKRALEEPKKFFEGYEMHCRKAFEELNNTNNASATSIVGAETLPAVLPTMMHANNLDLGYAPAAALMGQNLGAGKTPMFGLNGGFGLFSPEAGLSSALGRAGGNTQQPYSIGSANRAPLLGANNVSPSVIGNYTSFAALRGLGAYQNSPGTSAVRPQSGIDSLGTSGLQPFYLR